MLAFLKRLLAKPPRQRTDLHFVLYTRETCPLCDEAFELLGRWQKVYGFAIETKNVDADQELVCSYGNCVPVVEINGKVRFRGHVNEVLLRRILEH